MSVVVLRFRVRLHERGEFSGDGFLHQAAAVRALGGFFQVDAQLDGLLQLPHSSHVHVRLYTSRIEREESEVM